MFPTLFQIQRPFKDVSIFFKDFFCAYQISGLWITKISLGQKATWSIYSSFYQISDHAYQRNCNIVENMKCRPTLFGDICLLTLF